MGKRGLERSSSWPQVAIQGNPSVHWNSILSISQAPIIEYIQIQLKNLSLNKGCEESSFFLSGHILVILNTITLSLCGFLWKYTTSTFSLSPWSHLPHPGEQLYLGFENVSSGTQPITSKMVSSLITAGNYQVNIATVWKYQSTYRIHSLAPSSYRYFLQPTCVKSPYSSISGQGKSFLSSEDCKFL